MLTGHNDNIILRNTQLELGFKRAGGALSYLQHISSPVNPLHFSFQRSPGSTQYFTGHFICTPRWGDITTGEAARGLLKHGDCCHLDWSVDKTGDLMVNMQVYSDAELLSVKRTVQLHPDAPVFHVCETIQNHAPVYRPCNLVQHPTIAAPFLHAATRVDCNALTGWRDNGTAQLPAEAGTWPNVYNSRQEKKDLRLPTPEDEGVYSFITDNTQPGWVTALDPVTHLVLGYCWPVTDYPFMHHWVHTEAGHIKYRGLEFGTAALHQPFSMQQTTSFQWKEHPTCFFLDAGASATFQYKGFLCPVNKKATGVQSLTQQENSIELLLDGYDEPLILSTL